MVLGIYRKHKYVTPYITFMPFRRTRLDYIITTIAFIMFYLAFFPLSSFIGINQPSYQKTFYIVNDLVVIGPIILIYEWFQLIVLPGKRRGRELPWKLYKQILIEKITAKAKQGIDEYYYWRNKKQ